MRPHASVFPALKTEDTVMQRITRKTALTDLLIIPIAAEAVLAVNAAPAEADDNKACL